MPDLGDTVGRCDPDDRDGVAGLAEGRLGADVRGLGRGDTVGPRLDPGDAGRALGRLGLADPEGAELLGAGRLGAGRAVGRLRGAERVLGRSGDTGPVLGRVGFEGCVLGEVLGRRVGATLSEGRVGARGVDDVLGVDGLEGLTTVAFGDLRSSDRDGGVRTGSCELGAEGRRCSVGRPEGRR